MFLAQSCLAVDIFDDCFKFYNLYVLPSLEMEAGSLNF